MKKRVWNPMFAALLALSLALSSCGNKDKAIEKAYADLARTEGRLTNINATVKDGVVTLNGRCEDEGCRSYAEQSVREIKGVKSVVNNITVENNTVQAPVTVAPNAELEAGLRDATKDFPGVQARVENGVVILTGTVQRSRLTTLIQSVQALRPVRVENQLTIQ
jgi:hyperosmotically inducible protein